MRYRGFDLVQFLGFILLWSFAIVVEASIHEYRNEGFSRSLNSYFHGGSEGLYASKFHLSHPNSEDKPLNGESFIRYSPSISLFLSLLFLPLFVVFINVADIKIV